MNIIQQHYIPLYALYGILNTFYSYSSYSVLTCRSFTLCVCFNLLQRELGEKDKFHPEYFKYSTCSRRDNKADLDWLLCCVLLCVIFPVICNIMVYTTAATNHNNPLLITFIITLEGYWWWKLILLPQVHRVPKRLATIIPAGTVDTVAHRRQLALWRGRGESAFSLLSFVTGKADPISISI